MTKLNVARCVIGAFIAVWVIASQRPAQAREDWKTYTHPEAGFSLDYPGDLRTVPGKPDEETMPSQEFEWQFPDGEEGRQRAIFLGFYDMPEGETLLQWLQVEMPGKVDATKVGADRTISAFLRTALDTWAYEREVFVPDQKRGIVISISLVIQIAKRGTQGGIAAIEAEHAKDIETFTEMIGSFRFKSR